MNRISLFGRTRRSTNEFVDVLILPEMPAYSLSHTVELFPSAEIVNKTVIWVKLLHISRFENTKTELWISFNKFNYIFLHKSLIIDFQNVNTLRKSCKYLQKVFSVSTFLCFSIKLFVNFKLEKKYINWWAQNDSSQLLHLKYT